MRALWPEPDEHTGASNLDAARPTLRARRRFYQKPMEAVITAVTGLLHKVGAVWPFWGGRREEDRVPASPLRIEGRNGRKRSLPAETVVSSDSPSRGDNAENVFPRVPKRMKQSGAGALEDDGMVILQGKESPEVVVLGENSSTKSRRPKRLVRSPTTTYSVTEPSSDVQVVEEIIDLVKSPLKSSSKANHVDASSFSGAGSNKPFSDYDTFIRSCHVAPSAAAGKPKLKFAGDAFGRKSLPATTSRIVNGHASPPPLPPQYRVADRISSGDGQRPRFSAVTSTYQFHSSNASKDSLNIRDVSLPLNWKNKFPGASQPSVIGSPFLPRGGVMSSTPFNFRRKPVEVDLRADGETHSRVEQTSRASRSSYLERRSRDGVSFAAFAEMLAREEQRQLKDREAKIQLAREHVKESEEAAVKAQRALAESLRVKLRVTDVVLEEEEFEEIIEEGLDIEYQVAALTREAEDQIKKALLPVPKEQLLSEKFNIPIRRKDMVTLAPGAWLNDEIINFYLNMIVERSDSKGGHYPSVYAHPTFFFTTLQTKGYAGVRRWTRRVDIFAKDLVLIPVHLQVHWTAVVVDMKEKVVEFFDSMGSKRWDIVDSVLNYLCQEMKDKKNQELDVSEWKREIPDVPHQKNGWDCGMFACKFVEYRSRKAAIDFSQAEMPYFRRRMVWEILNKAFYRPN